MSRQDLPRRRFRREFKRLRLTGSERGVAVADVTPAFEVKPNLLHRCRRELRQGPNNAFACRVETSLRENPRYKRCGARSANRPWRVGPMDTYTSSTLLHLTALSPFRQNSALTAVLMSPNTDPNPYPKWSIPNTKGITTTYL